jgi:hypothetical protein
LSAAVVSIALGSSAAGATTIYVRAAASGANNGTSWTDAYTDLQLALAAAVSTDEIWVAAGTYKPTSTTDRTIRFVLKNGVGIYGGFTGFETMRSQRNPTGNMTILSGDIGTAGVATDNSYHVVTSDSTVTSSGILDGFTVTGGRADGAADPADRGGGAYINEGSPSFARIVFSANYAGNRGGGVRVAAGSPSFVECVFWANSAINAGGGLSAASVGTLLVRNGVFRSNSVTGNSTGGGGIEATDNTVLVNSDVAQNAPNGVNFLGTNNQLYDTTVAANNAYGLALFSTGNVIVNSIVYGNSVGSIFLGPSASVNVSYSDVQGGGFIGAGNINANPLFVNYPFDLRLGSGSPAIDAGSNSGVPFGTMTDLGGLPRLFDDPAVADTGAGTPPIVDMGSHERVPLTVSVPSPSSQTVCASASASFSVTASGAPPLTYQWRKSAVNLTNGGSTSGATTAMLTINPTATTNSGTYDVLVMDGYGQTVVSSTASLTVNSTATPVAGNNGPICVGQTLQLSASTVSGASYSWSGPNAFTSSQQNPSIPSATLAAAGSYSVTATVNACASAAGMTTVAVNSAPSAVISAPGAVCPNSAGHAASVPDAGVGATYAWTIGNGTITEGAGTRSITFSSGSSGGVTLNVTVQNGGCSAMGSKMVTILPPGCPGKFFTLAPCRVIDTRDAPGPWGGPALAGGAERIFPIAGRCDIPTGARSVSLNVTVVQPAASGYLSLYPGGTPLPLVSALNYAAGQIKANNATVPLSSSGTLAVFCGQGPGTAHLLIDVNGYFE